MYCRVEFTKHLIYKIGFEFWSIRFFANLRIRSKNLLKEGLSWSQLESKPFNYGTASIEIEFTKLQSYTVCIMYVLFFISVKLYAAYTRHTHEVMLLYYRVSGLEL